MVFSMGPPRRAYRPTQPLLWFPVTAPAMQIPHCSTDIRRSRTGAAGSGGTHGHTSTCSISVPKHVRTTDGVGLESRPCANCSAKALGEFAAGRLVQRASMGPKQRSARQRANFEDCETSRSTGRDFEMRRSIAKCELRMQFASLTHGCVRASRLHNNRRAR